MTKTEFTELLTIFVALAAMIVIVAALAMTN